MHNSVCFFFSHYVSAVHSLNALPVYIRIYIHKHIYTRSTSSWIANASHVHAHFYFVVTTKTFDRFFRSTTGKSSITIIHTRKRNPQLFAMDFQMISINSDVNSIQTKLRNICNLSICHVTIHYYSINSVFRSDRVVKQLQFTLPWYFFFFTNFIPKFILQHVFLSFVLKYTNNSHIFEYREASFSKNKLVI